MKKYNLIKAISVVLLSVCMVFTSTAGAQAATSVSNVCEGVALVAESVVEAYETSVIAQMSGRAGSATANGAKGIAFEVLYKDMKNLENCFCIFKPAERFSLSLSSTDELADLIVTSKDAGVIRFIQCKDGTSDSQIRKILQQVLEGKYDNASLVGTKECAAEFNRLAAAKGIDARMVDSGISTKTTMQIAEKAVGGNIVTLAKAAVKSGCVGGALCGAVSAIESVINGDTVPQIMGNVSIDALNGFVSMSGASVAGNLIAMGFAAFEAPEVVVTVGVFAATIIAGSAIMASLEKISSVLKLKDQAAQSYDELLQKTGDFLVEADEAIGKFGKTVAAKTSEAIDSAGKNLAKTGDYLKTTVGGWLKK
ncbi:MAG: hypothetical protein K6G63_09435 [Eubacterium sp.]|nr:hypothetical protein [Eubacterium sp.]